MFSPLIQRWRRVKHSQRVILFLCVLLLLAVLSSLARYWYQTPQQQSQSVLLLSNPGGNLFTPVTLLTMVRLSDGHVLWQYHIHGALNATADQLSAGNAVRIVDGLVYFVENTLTDQNGPAQHPYNLIALRADTGTPVWQKSLQVTWLTIVSINQGLVICEQSTAATTQASTITLTGLRANNGAQAWTRTIAGQIDYSNVLTQLLAGTLYITSALPWTVTALNANTGEQMWRYSTTTRFISIAPFTASRKVVVLLGVQMITNVGETIVATRLNLQGINQQNGQPLWSKDISEPGGFTGTFSTYSPVNGNDLLYFTTNDTALALNALRLTDGKLQWQRHLNSHSAISGRMIVQSHGVLYLSYSLVSSPLHPQLFFTAIKASTGTPLWQKSYVSSFGAPSLAIINGTTTLAAVAETNTSQHRPLLGVSATQGNVLWQNGQTVFLEGVVYGKLMARIIISDRQQQLCALAPESGQALWCQGVTFNQGWYVTGT
jgi:outer membrane protein assembly factor BamB